MMCVLARGLDHYIAHHELLPKKEVWHLITPNSSLEMKMRLANATSLILPLCLLLFLSFLTLARQDARYPQRQIQDREVFVGAVYQALVHLGEDQRDLVLGQVRDRFVLYNSLE